MFKLHGQAWFPTTPPGGVRAFLTEWKAGGTIAAGAAVEPTCMCAINNLLFAQLSHHTSLDEAGDLESTECQQEPNPCFRMGPCYTLHITDER